MAEEATQPSPLETVIPQSPAKPGKTEVMRRTWGRELEEAWVILMGSRRGAL